MRAHHQDKRPRQHWCLKKLFGSAVKFVSLLHRNATLLCNARDAYTRPFVKCKGAAQIRGVTIFQNHGLVRNSFFSLEGMDYKFYHRPDCSIMIGSWTKNYLYYFRAIPVHLLPERLLPFNHPKALTALHGNHGTEKWSQDRILRTFVSQFWSRFRNVARQKRGLIEYEAY